MIMDEVYGGTGLGPPGVFVLLTAALLCAAAQCSALLSAALLAPDIDSKR